MPFGMRQQKLDKLCRGYKILRPRLTKYCWERVPGGVEFSLLQRVKLWSTCVLFRQSLRPELTS